MSENVPELKRLAVFKTKLPPCCLRIYENVVYIGTYKLVEGDNRYGSIEVWKFNEQQDDFIKVREYPTKGAILDLKLDPFEKGILCSCHSRGNLIFWKIDAEDPTMLTKLHDRQVYDPKILITAINYHKQIPHKMVVTTTSGLCSIYDEETDESTDFATSHDLECWYADFCSQPGLEQLTISGGDDGKMIIHDMRDPDSVVCSNGTFHQAGVVSVLASSKDWLASSPYTIWTGSYDDHVRSIDLRYIEGDAGSVGCAYPKIKQKLDLHGGVWKLIPSPAGNSDNRVLTCCMYDGARMLGYDADSGAGITVKNYFKKDHSSICYGGDWKNDLVVTCSFYDNVVQAWRS
ncbi:hypothetical protein BRETT_003498 [Brettanomyces bruxellensis]|uniref:Diphthine methyltransferase n=1 Tax=Dekkera bruxellensis TaxID=5007 RepID=A0A871R9R4_DEKBR|nr:uncharacterized protein BRETT_003498 [Brettanomyces bruxellensis]QOU19351.1 hypothetical protein BRETT_003498 [Brettanomyces bruxellensis]